MKEIDIFFIILQSEKELYSLNCHGIVLIHMSLRIHNQTKKKKHFLRRKRCLRVKKWDILFFFF